MLRIELASDDFSGPFETLKAMRTLLLTGLSALLTVTAVATQTRPSEARDSLAMRTVARLLQQDYLTEQQLDDKISRQALTAYVETLDPLKYYFEKTDLEEFERHGDELDDLLRDGEPFFAHRVYKRYLARLEERVATAEEWLDAEHDFTVEEWLITDPEHATYPDGGDDARDRWRKRIKYDLLTLRANGSTDEEARERLQKRYRGFRRRMQRVEPDEIVQMFISSVTSSFDPHSTYMGAHQLENFEIHMRLDYQGVGALLVEREGEILIERILPGGPAERAGTLKAGDQIVSVAQGDDEAVDVIGMRLRDVVRQIRGKADTVVQLGIVPAKGGATQIVKCVRGRTELKEEAAEGEVREHKGPDGKTVKVGWIDLPSFYGRVGSGRSADARSATRDLRRLLNDFTKQEVKVVVLDLRWNGGGYLSEAVDVTGLFIDEGPVVQVKGYDGRVRILSDEAKGVAWDGPLVVLTSKLSASASEIVAAAIKDYGRGLVVGDDQSHGKGTVQTVLPLDPPGSKPRLGALKLTTQKFYRINGSSTQLRGVRADVTLPSITNVGSKGEAQFENALPYDSIDPLPYLRYEGVDAPIVEQLLVSSRTRRGGSDEFVALERRIDAYERFRDQTRVPLNEKQFKAFRDELEEADRQEPTPEVAEDEKSNPAEDSYVSEVMGIAVDYARALGERTLASHKAKNGRPKKG